MKLTARGMEKLKAKPDGEPETYWDAQVRGLIVVVRAPRPGTARGVITYSAWYRVHGTGKAGRLKLGRHEEGVFGLADAREKAQAALRLAALGKDPAGERRRAKKSDTFGTLAKDFLAVGRSKWGPKLRPTTLNGWRALLEQDRLASLRAQRPADITKADLKRLFERIGAERIDAGGKGYIANRTFEVVRRVFSWAMEEDLVTASPCVGIKRPVSEEPREAEYTSAQLGAIVRALDDSAMGDALRLCLYTGVRIEQALGAPWAEFDLERPETVDASDLADPGVAWPGPRWHIAANRTGNKSGKPWIVPLVPAAVEVLERRVGDPTFVFAVRSRKGTGAGRAWRQQRVVYDIRTKSGVSQFRPHDLRSMLTTWLSSQGVPPPVRNAILGHKPSKLEGTYNKYKFEPEKRAALERWSAHIARVVAAKPAKVLPMGNRA